MALLQWNAASAKPRIAIRAMVIALIPGLFLATMTTTPASALPPSIQCARAYNSCNDSCRLKFSNSADLLNSCFNRCSSVFDKCLKAQGIFKK